MKRVAEYADMCNFEDRPVPTPEDVQRKLTALRAPCAALDRPYSLVIKRQETFADIAAELARLPVDVIVTGPNTVAAAAGRATATIPIVAVVANPVETGFVAGLAQPRAANIAALSTTVPGLGAKKLELLRDMVPGLARVAALVNVTTPVYDVGINELMRTATQVGIHVDRIDLRSPDEMDEGVSRATLSAPDALYLAQHPLFEQVRDRLATLILQHRLPAIAETHDYVVSGLLMSHGSNFAASYRRAAAGERNEVRRAAPIQVKLSRKKPATASSTRRRGGPSQKKWLGASVSTSCAPGIVLARSSAWLNATPPS
jgi:hypothetical protein